MSRGLCVLAALAILAGGCASRRAVDRLESEVGRLRTELAEYFDRKRKVFTFPLHAPGTPFEERVWKALLTIPYGEVRSYTDIANAVGAPKAVRAVGRANGMNRIAIVIPCHRVIGKDGSPVGYGGGLWRKQRLLDLERGVSSLEL